MTAPPVPRPVATSVVGRDAETLARTATAFAVLAAAFGAVHALAAWWLGDPTIVGFAGIHFATAAVAAAALVHLRRGNLDAGIDTLIAGVFVGSVAWAVFVPGLRDVAALGPILGLTAALPYRRGRAFARIVVAALVTLGAIIVIAGMSSVAIASAYLDAVRVPSLIAVTVLIVLILWRFSRTLQGSLDQASDADGLLRTRQQALDATSSGVLILDVRRPDWRIEYVNPAVERITGYRADELVGTDGLMLVGPETDPDVLARHRAMISRGEDGTVTIRNHRRDGTVFWNELTVSPIREPDGTIERYVVIQTDVTVRRALEEQLRQAQRMESVGQLAGGVAHDFNNLLTAIGGYTQLARDQAAGVGPAAVRVDLEESLDEIGRATERAARLTRQLLAFGRRQHLEREAVSLGSVAEELAPMLRRLVGELHRLEVHIDHDVPPVLADRGQLEQVLVNLVVNARDAQPDGGPIRIAVSRTERGPGAGDDAPAGTYARLRVSDEGTGIAPDVLARMYEPFFTTKSREAGTGLGLATVDGIIAQTGGQIRCRTAEGVGTTFEIDLPAHDLVAASAASDVSPVRRTPSPTAASTTETTTSTAATVLVVEDEPAILALAETILARAGYRVLAANGVPEALDLAAGHLGEIGLLLSDVVMPGMRGPDLAARLTRERDMPVLFMSGYTDSALESGGPPLVSKPFTPDELLAAVGRTLRDAAATSPVAVGT